MVTNLPENVKAQWRRVIAARTPEEKLAELRKFYSMVPKHKGTKNLIKQVKRQIARLREEIEWRRSRKYTVYISNWNKAKHGVARIAILGNEIDILSDFFMKLTDKNIYFSNLWSFEPIYGVLSGGYIQFQLSLLPPIGISRSIDNRTFSYIKSTVDYLLLVSSSISMFKSIINELIDYGLYIGRQYRSIDIKEVSSGGIRIIGQGDIDYEEVKKLLHSYRIYNAIIKVDGKVSLSDIEDYILRVRTVKYGLAAIYDNGKIDVYQINKGVQVSFLDKFDKAIIINQVLRDLGLIRIFTRHYKDEPLGEPIILTKGSRVIDLAEKIHSNLKNRFRYAIIYRDGTKIKVSKNFRLEDMDIVTIYA